ncbi:MAG: hypothetical protein BroJett011_14360 [Chloroflexota bacterium]|nr:MAG: hypothetical protein BroJett011_14360 [Chloroflexota bacterium]
MVQPNFVNISFSAPDEIKELLFKWAKEDDRPVSSLLRQLIQQEKERREAQVANQKPVAQSY